MGKSWHLVRMAQVCSLFPILKFSTFALISNITVLLLDNLCFGTQYQISVWNQSFITTRKTKRGNTLKKKKKESSYTCIIPYLITLSQATKHFLIFIIWVFNQLEANLLHHTCIFTLHAWKKFDFFIKRKKMEFVI